MKFYLIPLFLFLLTHTLVTHSNLAWSAPPQLNATQIKAELNTLLSTSEREFEQLNLQGIVHIIRTTPANQNAETTLRNYPQSIETFLTDLKQKIMSQKTLIGNSYNEYTSRFNEILKNFLTLQLSDERYFRTQTKYKLLKTSTALSLAFNLHYTGYTLPSVYLQMLRIGLNRDQITVDSAFLNSLKAPESFIAIALDIEKNKQLTLSNEVILGIQNVYQLDFLKALFNSRQSSVLIPQLNTTVLSRIQSYYPAQLVIAAHVQQNFSLENALDPISSINDKVKFDFAKDAIRMNHPEGIVEACFIKKNPCIDSVHRQGGDPTIPNSPPNAGN